MKKGFFLIALFSIMMFAPAVFSAENQDITLAKHPASVKVDLVAALEHRKSIREYSAKKLSPEDLSAILWAANGVNRPDGKRTAPSAYGKEYIDIYVVTDTGSYLYDAPKHELKFILGANVKNKMSGQGFVAKASHILVLVSDTGKIPGLFLGKEGKLTWANATAGAIAQNVYLMSAAKGIGTCFVAGIQADDIKKALGLSKDMVPIYVMPLGYEKK
jgi:nitroreductase